MYQKRGTIPEILAKDRERERERGRRLKGRTEQGREQDRRQRDRKAPDEIKGPELPGGTSVSPSVWLLAWAVNLAFNVRLESPRRVARVIEHASLRAARAPRARDNNGKRCVQRHSAAIFGAFMNCDSLIRC